jgi:hypothetical protein
MMRRMRWWRARRYEPVFDDEPPENPDAGWEDAEREGWAQEWVLPRAEDTSTTDAPTAPFTSTTADAATATADAATATADAATADTATANTAAEVQAPPPDLSTELVRVLEVVTTMCGHVITFVEGDREERRLATHADREERRAMIDVLAALVTRIGDVPALAPPREKVLGGSMNAAPEAVIDLREFDLSRPVRCRFGDHWLDGFEVAEKVEDDSGVRYRLRRRTDGALLPQLFAADDIRTTAAATDDAHQISPPAGAETTAGAWSAAITTAAARDEVGSNPPGPAGGPANAEP